MKKKKKPTQHDPLIPTLSFINLYSQYKFRQFCSAFLIFQAMFRALSTRRSDRKLQRLADESSAGLLEAKLEKATSLPAKILFGSPRESSRHQELNFPAKKASKIHPLFGLFDALRRRKKPTAKPEFARYVEYMKEGGVWDVNSNVPVMYYK